MFPVQLGLSTHGHIIQPDCQPVLRAPTLQLYSLVCDREPACNEGTEAGLNVVYVTKPCD